MSKRCCLVDQENILAVANSPKDFQLAIGDFNKQIIFIPPELNIYSDDEIISSFVFKNNQFTNTLVMKSRQELRVALIANYGSKCGIGTYAKFLYQYLIPQLGDFRIFAEQSDDLELESFNLDKDKIDFCWKRGEPLTELAQKVKAYQPDIVFIQHEWGIFPVARHWLALLTQLSSFRVITTMHSVYYHPDKMICEAAMPEIVVHLEQAKKVLLEKGISNKVTHIPHGCFVNNQQGKLWNLYQSEHTFCQFGFLFGYKNIGESIRATALLKEKYPDVFFTAICSENEYAKKEHQRIYNELMILIDDLNVRENVALIRGYQSEKSLDAYLRTNKVGVFPYSVHPEHLCFGASGSAPYAMAKGLPLITSSIPHFSELPTLRADNAQEIAYQLDYLFSDRQKIKQQVDLQNKYLENNSWDKVADRYLSLFENKY